MNAEAHNLTHGANRPTPAETALSAFERFSAPVFDALTAAAQALLDVPVCVIVTAAADRLWMRTEEGFEPLEQPEASASFFHRVVREPIALVVPDALADPHFAANPYVARENGYRFFVGVPVRGGDGETVGAICGLDRIARLPPEPGRLAALTKLADAAMAALALQESEAALGRRRELMQATLDAVSQGISAFDADLRLVAWNSRMIEMMRLPQELVFEGAPYEEIARHLARSGTLGNGDPESAVAARAAELKRFKPYVAEMVFPGDRIIEIKGAPLPRGGFVATHTDVTELRDHARRLRRDAARFQAESRMGSIANAAPTLDAALERFLRELCEEMGFAYGAISATPARRSELRATAIRYSRDRMRPFPIPEGAVSALAEEACCELGAPVFVDAHPALDPRAGEPTGGLVFVTEILNQRYVIEAFGGASLRPSRWYGEVMSYLGRQFDHVAERDKVRRLKDGFLSAMNHELRTPLTALSGAIDLVHAQMLGPLTPEAADLLQVAQQNARRLGGLIGDILEIGEIEADAGRFALQTTPVAPLLAQVASAMTGEAQTAGVQIAVVRGTENAASTNAARLRQALRHLMSNAIKFSPAGSDVVLSVEARPSSLRVSVGDCGPGIAEAFQPRLFTKFAQADSSDSRGASGTGLGLAIVKVVADRLGAGLSYETSPQGTVFHIDLPLTADDRRDGDNGTSSAGNEP